MCKLNRYIILLKRNDSDGRGFVGLEEGLRKEFSTKLCSVQETAADEGFLKTRISISMQKCSVFLPQPLAQVQHL